MVVVAVVGCGGGGEEEEDEDELGLVVVVESCVNSLLILVQLSICSIQHNTQSSTI